MKSAGGSEAAKQRAAEEAVQLVDDGMVVGLGTGSTAAYAIAEIGRAIDAGFDVRGVATSYQARDRALEAGIPLIEPSDTERLDLAIDGADQVANAALLKGGGAAHAMEKVVAVAADQFVIVVDETKLADSLDLPVPVEVLPEARGVVGSAIRECGGDPALRAASGKDGPVVTDNGNLVLDADFGRIGDPRGVAKDLTALAGVIEHGLFVGLADAIYVGRDDGVEVRDGEN